MDSTKQFPDLVTEIHRYTAPEDIFRFFTLEPAQVSFDHINHKPFSERGSRQGPNYIESFRKQVRAEAAANNRVALTEEGFRPVQFIELPEPLRSFVIYNQAPIEWHQGLEGNHPNLIWKVTVWVRGEFPDSAVKAEPATFQAQTFAQFIRDNIK